MTTRREAEAALFESHMTSMTKVTLKTYTAHTPDRRRLEATYCPICRGWVEVRLNPVRLHCTGCGMEARP